MKEKLKKFKQRSLSWSSMSLFALNQEKWYRKYILGEVDDTNPQIAFGKEIGVRLANDLAFLPEVPRYRVMEKKLEGMINHIRLLGYLDSFCPKTNSFYEYKTSSNARKWTKESAQNHGQMLFYMALIWLNYKKKPEDIKSHLIYIPVHDMGEDELVITKGAEIQKFQVKHTLVEVLQFLSLIKQTHDEMIKFIANHE